MNVPYDKGYAAALDSGDFTAYDAATEAGALGDVRYCASLARSADSAMAFPSGRREGRCRLLLVSFFQRSMKTTPDRVLSCCLIRVVKKSSVPTFIPL